MAPERERAPYTTSRHERVHVLHGPVPARDNKPDQDPNQQTHRTTSTSGSEQTAQKPGEQLATSVDAKGKVEKYKTPESFQCKQIYENIGMAVFEWNSQQREKRLVAYGPKKKQFTDEELIKGIITYTAPTGYSLVLISKTDKNVVFPVVAGDAWTISASFDKDKYELAQLGPGKALVPKGQVKVSDLKYLKL